MTVVNASMEQSLTSIDGKMSDLVRTFGDVLAELKRNKSAPFDKSKK